MGFRESVNNRQVGLTIVCIVVLTGAVYVIAGSLLSNGDAVDQVYFYDLNQGGLIAVPIASVAPISLPGGEHSGVKARVYGCGAKQEILWIEKFHMNIRDQVEAGELPFATPLLRRVDDSDGSWVEFNSPEGQLIRSNGYRALGCEPGQPPREVFP